MGVGSVGLAAMAVAFQLSQIQRKVEEINRKLDVVLSAPLKLASAHLGKAWIHMESLESRGYADGIKELEKARDQALMAFQYAEGQGATMENLKNAVTAKRLSIFSEVLIQS